MTSKEEIEKQISDSFVEGDPLVSEETKKVFEEYSGIPEGEQVEHLKDIRAKGWKICPYPCIGRYSFIEFTIGEHPLYPTVLQSLKNGARLLDLGCCFGQDIRKLVFEGAPAESITGSELHPEFIQLGYELFKDKDKLETPFKVGDFFASETARLENGSFDFVHAGSFLHLFSREEQIEAVGKIVRLLKKKEGSVFFGRLIGSDPPEVVRHPKLRKGELYKHNRESFERMIGEVEGRLGVKLEVEVGVKEREWESGGLMLRFAVTVRGGL